MKPRSHLPPGPRPQRRPGGWTDGQGGGRTDRRTAAPPHPRGSLSLCHTHLWGGDPWAGGCRQLWDSSRRDSPARCTARVATPRLPRAACNYPAIYCIAPSLRGKSKSHGSQKKKPGLFFLRANGSPRAGRRLGLPIKRRERDGAGRWRASPCAGVTELLSFCLFSFFFVLSNRCTLKPRISGELCSAADKG